MKQAFHKLLVPNRIASLIRNLHPHIKNKVRASLKEILLDPFSGKELKEDLEGLRSFRVSRFRIIYRISPDKVIEIVALGPRERIYEETFKILMKGD